MMSAKDENTNQLSADVICTKKNNKFDPPTEYVSAKTIIQICDENGGDINTCITYTKVFDQNWKDIPLTAHVNDFCKAVFLSNSFVENDSGNVSENEDLSSEEEYTCVRLKLFCDSELYGIYALRFQIVRERVKLIGVESVKG